MPPVRDIPPAAPCPPGLAIVEAGPADAEAVAALVREAFAELVPLVAPPPSAVRETGARIAAHLAEGGSALMVVSGHARETPLAVCLFHPVADGLHVARLAVSPAHRRRGLALALLGEAERRARALGLGRLVLQTRLALASNRALFASAGFREVSFHAHPGFDAPTFVEMEKGLAPGPA